MPNSFESRSAAADLSSKLQPLQGKCRATHGALMQHGGSLTLLFRNGTGPINECPWAVRRLR
jgi:hypothetical protein